MTRIVRNLAVAFVAGTLALGVLGAITYLARSGPASTARSSTFAAPSPRSAAPPSAPAPPLVAPPPALLPPNGAVSYRSISSGVPITAPDNRPVAALSRVPATLSQSTGFVFPGSAHPVDTGSRPSYQVLSVVRYSGEGGTLSISTSRPSASALQGLQLGNSSIQLPDGTVAWIAPSGPSGVQMRWLKQGLIVTLTGSLPSSELKRLAPDVVVR